MKTLITSISVCLAFSAMANSNGDSSQFYFAKGMAEKTAKRYQVASTMFEKAIKFDAKNVEAYIENAKVNVEMHRTDPALLNYVKANELQPSNSAVIKELATMYYNYHQWDKAITFVSKCNDCENRDLLLGMCNFKKENNLEAEQYLLKALAKNPNDAETNHTIGLNYMDMEAYRKAIPFFEKAVSLDPTKSAWAYDLGLLYFNNNNYRSAASAFETAQKNGYTVNNEFTENYGYALLQGGLFAKGEEQLMIIYKKKGNKEILRDIAQQMYKMQQYDRALDYCQRLLEIDPKDGKALYQAGLTFIKMGKKDKGQGMCDKAIELDPSLAGKKSALGDMSGGL
jgi:tetratricopeptide (TPR) repeat protein